MRKLLVVAMVLLAAFAFAGGKAEVAGGPVTVGIWGADRPIDPKNVDSLAFYQDYLFGGTDVEITWYHPGDGAAQPIDLDIAAGTQPDVYSDYLGRTNKYANAKYAEELTPLLPEGTTDKFIPSFLDLMTKDGGLYGLPESAWAQCMVVNVDLLEQVGMGDVIADGGWTIDDFNEASRRVAALGDDYYGFIMFAASTGGDYWHLGFIPGFGAKLFENNQIALGSAEGLEAMRWYADYQYKMPGAAGLDYSAMFSAFNTGKVLAQGGSWGHLTVGASSFEAGISETAFVTALVAYPHVRGVEAVPLALGPDGAMIFKGRGSPAAVDALLTLTGERSQKWRVAMEGRFSSLKALEGLRSDAGHAILSDLIAKNGVFDLGLSLTEYTLVRNLVPPMFQAIYSGEMSVDAAVARFVAEGSEILK